MKTAERSIFAELRALCFKRCNAALMLHLFVSFMSAGYLSTMNSPGVEPIGLQYIAAIYSATMGSSARLFN